MNPMTVGYLSKLSLGKPNQIRLICQSIYNRYERGKQKDLNITIDVLDDVLETIAHEDTELKQKIDKIKGLNSVDLDILYNLTRYPDWSVKEIIELDESFRGEQKCEQASRRRERLLSEKHDYFVRMGLMSSGSEKYMIAGGEFISLYLRFFYEIRKYGKLSKKLVLRQGPATPFSEKCAKLVSSVYFTLGHTAELRNSIFHSYQRDYGDIVGTVIRRFSVLSELRNGKHPEANDLAEVLNECLGICELIGKPGKYYLLCLSVRNLDNPRELMQIELYFDSKIPLIVDLTSLVNVLNKQAEDARVLIEGFGDTSVELPDLAGLLKEVGGTTIEEVMSTLTPVDAWRMGSIQHEIRSREENKGPEDEDEASEEEKDWGKWVKLYGTGDELGAEEFLNKKMESTGDRIKRARMYNDRGYIRASDKLKKNDLARRDLETSLDLHHKHLETTLLNLSCLDIDKGDYEQAVRRIEEALLISLSRIEVSVAYLRLRLPENHLGFVVRLEQHPANILEASYINLGYTMLKWKGYEEALKTFEEGLGLMPSSIRLKHALGRLYLHKMRADLADPIYRELAQMPKLPDVIKLEIQRLGRRISTGGRKKGEKHK
jgi:tetratricopeptide (TPR) repeat protein